MSTAELQRLWYNRARGLNDRVEKAGRPGRVRAIDLESIVLRDRSCCYWCGRALDFMRRGSASDLKRPSFDHVWPMKAGGLNGPENIVCACQGCNRTRNQQPDILVALYSRLAVA